MTKPTRRAALAGIAGTLALATRAVGAVAVQSSQVESNPDAELIALCDRYILEWVAYEDALTREGDAQEAARDNRPDCPAELYEPLQFVDGPKGPSNSPTSVASADDRPYWSRGLLECYAKPDSTSWRNEVENGEGVRTIRMLTFPMPEPTRALCRELIEIHDRWDAEIEAGKATYRALEALSEEANQRCWDTLGEILDYEPETLAGIAAMSRLALATNMMETSSDEHSQLEETILKAIVRFNGGAV